MPTYEYTLTIDAPRRRVWDLVSDVEGWPEITASTTSVEALDEKAPDGGALAVGKRFALVQPRLRKAVWTVTELRPGAGFSWESKAPGAVIRADHLLQDEDGGTRLTLVVVQTGPLAGLIGLLFGGLTRKYTTMEAHGFKARAEAAAGA